jgi:hypothetical protein
MGANRMRSRGDPYQIVPKSENSVTDNPIDSNRLAALRPGETQQVLADILAVRWRAPALHQQGRVTAVSRLSGFEAQIDTSGHIGLLRYREPFPGSAEIAGLRIGMTVEAALAALPQLSLAFRLPVYESATYKAAISSHYQLAVEFRWGKLHAVTFRNPLAVYPEKQAMAYPASAGTPGAPFGDPNFKLVVLSSLLESDALDLAEPADLARFVLGRPVDLEKEGYRLIREAYDYLVRYPLTEADLARVETLTFDGGNDIYPYCFKFWDGETREFDVASIAGIGLCRNLRRLTFIALIERIDAADLAGLDKLEEIDLPATCTSPERLLDLPALKRLTFRRSAIGEAVIATLRSRGATLRIHD